MLVLTRKKGESVLVGENIVVTVIEVRGDKIRLGFEAPRDVLINRTEVAPEQQKRPLKVRQGDGISSD